MMTLNEYQEQAQVTDQNPEKTLTGDVIPLLGLAGEVGSLLTEYKKHYRDGDAYRVFRERIAEELGDILWYTATVASRAGLDLASVAAGNLTKVRSRWMPQSEYRGGAKPKLFDEDYPATEQLPREIEVRLTEVEAGAGARVMLSRNDKQVGDQLTDNSNFDDGYRFHDIFHLAYAIALGWSPVVRKLLGCKRKSDPRIDEVEDGARAAAIEEGITAIVFAHARTLSFFEGVSHVDYELLARIKQATSHLEVGRCSLKEWEDAILLGFGIWRSVYARRGGLLRGNMVSRTLEIVGA